MAINDITERQWDYLRGGKKQQEYMEAVHRHNAELGEAIANEIKFANENQFGWAGTGGGQTVETRASATQVGGSHYKKFPIQPAEFCHVNKIPYLEATAIKYLCRWRDKGGFEDLDKAKHFIDLIMEYENAHK